MLIEIRFLLTLGVLMQNNHLLWSSLTHLSSYIYLESHRPFYFYHFRIFSDHKTGNFIIRTIPTECSPGTYTTYRHWPQSLVALNQTYIDSLLLLLFFCHRVLLFFFPLPLLFICSVISNKWLFSSFDVGH